MPVSFLNNASPGVTYTDAFTVVFYPYRVTGFALNLANASIFYQLAVPGPGASTLDVIWEPFEHFLIPGMQRFNNPGDEGFPFAHAFAAVRVRAAAAGSPAPSVTVI